MKLFKKFSVSMMGLLALSCLTIACSDSDAGSEGDANGASFMNLDFILESSDGFEPADGGTVRIRFREGEMSELGFFLGGGCNSVAGDFTLTDGVMNVTLMGMTEMACDTALMEQDDWFVAFLQASPGFDYSNDRVTLTGTDATLVFLDSELADPDRDLVGAEWTINSFMEGGSVSAVNLSTTPTVVFGENGEVEVFTGCNTGGGAYSVEGSTITFSEVSYTRAGCEDDNASWADAHIQSVIVAGSVSYEIDAARLTLEGESKGLGAYTE